MSSIGMTFIGKNKTVSRFLVLLLIIIIIIIMMMMMMMMTFLLRENANLSAAILYLTVCITDVTNKAGLCGKSIKYVTSHAFCALHW